MDRFAKEKILTRHSITCGEGSEYFAVLVKQSSKWTLFVLNRLNWNIPEPVKQRLHTRQRFPESSIRQNATFDGRTIRCGYAKLGYGFLINRDEQRTI